jgi:hypothetical protein
MALQSAASLLDVEHAVACCRPVPAQEYAQWLPRFEAAKTTMQDREAALDAAAELVERDLLLLGATAIEDKLQQASFSSGAGATVSMQGRSVSCTVI